MAYQIRSSQHLPSGGDREGADVHWQSNLFLPLGKVRMGYPPGETERGLKMVTGETYFYSRYQPPLDRISPHLASPVGEGQIHLTA